MVRLATADDFPAAAQLLFDFNTEYEEVTPPPDRIAQRLAEVDDTAVLLAGEPPHGIAVLRFRKAIWTAGLEAYLAELYVAPAHRGEGDGRALLEAVIALAKERGADWLELNTDDDDTVAHALYESAGLRRTAHYYERDL